METNVKDLPDKNGDIQDHFVITLDSGEQVRIPYPELKEWALSLLTQFLK